MLGHSPASAICMHTTNPEDMDQSSCKEKVGFIKKKKAQ